MDSDGLTYDIPTIRPYTLRGHDGHVTVGTFSPDGKSIVTADFSGVCYLWDSENGKKLAELRYLDSIILDVKLSPDGGKIITTSWDAYAIVWDAVTQERLRVFPYNKHAPKGAIFDASGTRVILATSEKFIDVFDILSGEDVFTIYARYGYYRAIATNISGSSVALANPSGPIEIWNACSSGTYNLEFVKLIGSEGIKGFTDLTFSPNSDRIAARPNERSIVILDVLTGDTVCIISIDRYGLQSPIRDMTFTPDGNAIITADDGGYVTFYDTQDGKKLYRSQLHLAAINSIAVSPTGDKLLTASNDETASIWELTTL